MSDIRELIAQAIIGTDPITAWDDLPPGRQKLWLGDADRVLAVLEKEGWTPHPVYGVVAP